jgi:hypothetical protein
VYWSVNKEDVVDSFQVYCVEEPQDDQEINGKIAAELQMLAYISASYCKLRSYTRDNCI